MKRRIALLTIALLLTLVCVAQDAAQAIGGCSCCFCRSETEYCCDMPLGDRCEPVCEWVLSCQSPPAMCGGQ